MTKQRPARGIEDILAASDFKKPAEQADFLEGIIRRTATKLAQEFGKRRATDALSKVAGEIIALKIEDPQGDGDVP